MVYDLKPIHFKPQFTNFSYFRLFDEFLVFLYDTKIGQKTKNSSKRRKFEKFGLKMNWLLEPKNHLKNTHCFKFSDNLPKIIFGC